MAAEKQSKSPDQVDMTNMEAFLIQDGSYIDASNDEILTEYDSVAEYIQDGLSLSQQEIFQLQESLLSA
jgi:protein tyrosine/serine phosphatase